MKCIKQSQETLNFVTKLDFRAHRLSESLQSQQYYAEASEAEHWMRERLLISDQQQHGNNQSVSELCLRRLNALEQEINTFYGQIQNLKKKLIYYICTFIYVKFL